MEQNRHLQLSAWFLGFITMFRKKKFKEQVLIYTHGFQSFGTNQLKPLIIPLGLNNRFFPENNLFFYEKPLVFLGFFEFTEITGG